MLLKVLFLVACYGIVASVREKRQESSTTTNTPSAVSSIGDPGESTFKSSGQRELIADANGKIIVKVGHIGAIGALPNDDKVIEISRNQLVDEGLLGKDIDFELVFQNDFLPIEDFQDNFTEWLWRVFRRCCCRCPNVSCRPSSSIHRALL